jgi:hypothetical protein
MTGGFVPEDLCAALATRQLHNSEVKPCGGVHVPFAVVLEFEFLRRA